ncbi:MAG: epimerase [Pseudomonadota bacterium]
MQRWLVFGGTRFVGHHIAAAARARGHALTLFHRGETPAHLDGPVEEILGDRDGDLHRLAGRRWDAVIDVCGYLPRLVAAAAAAVQAEHYTFISSVSVYAPRALGLPPLDEGVPVRGWDGPPTEEITEERYGPLKVDCERAVAAHFAGTKLVIRPGYVVGPGDRTQRFSWWLHRLQRPGPLLVPANAHVPLQVIDARDLAAFVVRATEARVEGAFDCVGPARPWGAVYACAGPDTRPVAVDGAWLAAQGVDEDALPMWLPPDRLAESLIASGARARAAGLTLRPLAETVADILAEPPGDLPAERLSPEREAPLLAAWEARP